jgi:hypothetical protein
MRGETASVAGPSRTASLQQGSEQADRRRAPNAAPIGPACRLSAASELSEHVMPVVILRRPLMPTQLLQLGWRRPRSMSGSLLPHDSGPI